MSMSVFEEERPSKEINRDFFEDNPFFVIYSISSTTTQPFKGESYRIGDLHIIFDPDGHRVFAPEKLPVYYGTLLTKDLKRMKGHFIPLEKGILFVEGKKILSPDEFRPRTQDVVPRVDAVRSLISKYFEHIRENPLEPPQIKDLLNSLPAKDKRGFLVPLSLLFSSKEEKMKPAQILSMRVTPTILRRFGKVLLETGLFETREEKLVASYPLKDVLARGALSGKLTQSMKIGGKELKMQPEELRKYALASSVIFDRPESHEVEEVWGSLTDEEKFIVATRYLQKGSLPIPSVLEEYLTGSFERILGKVEEVPTDIALYLADRYPAAGYLLHDKVRPKEFIDAVKEMIALGMENPLRNWPVWAVAYLVARAVRS